MSAAASAAPPPSPTLLHDSGASFGKWYQGLHNAISPPPPPPPVPGQPPPPPNTMHQAADATRRVQTVVASVAGALGTVQSAMDTGFAELTQSLAALFPALPAATLSMPYLGVPHIHQHPPSLIPPAPPIPLPSIGTILFGCHVRTMINGIPAARAGDLGLAPTCGGFTPYFEIVTGSSNVFIGGVRAARIGDFCKVCIAPDPAPSAIPAGKFLAAVGTAARAAGTVIGLAGRVTPFLGIAVDLMESEEAVQDDAALSAAKALSAAMAAAELAANLAKEAIAKLMGKDPGTPNMGAVVLGHPNVLLGGFPMINIPNPAQALLSKLSRYRGRTEADGGPGAGASGHC